MLALLHMNLKISAPSKLQGLVLTLLLTAVFIVIQYGGLLQNLDSTKCFEPYGDGIKTQLNAANHALYGHSYSYFEGMNYPYKEHIAAATELPGLAIFLRLLHPVFPNAPQYVFGITYLLLLVCIILGASFTYLIFARLKLPPWYAALLAFGLTVLSPQNLRFTAHLGLAPLFVVPAILYGLLLFERAASPRRKYLASGFLSLTVFVSALLHFYFFAITTFTISLYLFFSLLRKLDVARVKQYAAAFFIAVVIPLSFFWFWMMASDPVTDRSPNPWGFFYYRAIWQSVFFSLNLPLYQWINTHWIAIKNSDFEGWAYIGLVAGAYVFWQLLRWVGSFFKKKPIGIPGEEQHPFYYPLFWTGVVLLFLSFSYPFAIKGLEYLLEYAGPLKQFRSTGRFAWVFFYAINILAGAGFYRLFSSFKSSGMRQAAFTLLFATLFTESYFFTQCRSYCHGDKLVQIEELLPGHRFTDIPGIDYSKYQAIVPLPYYNVGSNNFGAGGGGESVQKSLILSFQTGLPVTGAMLTRSSRQQAFNQMQLVAEPYREPVVFQDYPSRKPLLVLYSHIVPPEDAGRYDHLLNNSTFLYEGPNWTLYEISLGDFSKNIEQRKAGIRAQIGRDSLFPVGPFLSTDSVKNFVFEDFDTVATALKYRGTGAKEGPLSATNLAYRGAIPNSKAGDAYHLLAWVYVGGDRYASCAFFVKEQDANGAELKINSFIVSRQIVAYDPNGWVLVDCPFRVLGGSSVFTVTFHMDGRDERIIAVDELLIKPQAVHLYQDADGTLWFDNRFWKE